MCIRDRCGSIADLNATVEIARAKGFAGRIYLGNAGMNTELNSIVLVSLAQVLTRDFDGNVLLSANQKLEGETAIRQVYPQVTVDNEDPCLLTPPEGPGWGAALCQSVLMKRMHKSDFLRDADATPDKELLKTQLIMSAFDDSRLHVRRLQDDDDDQGDHGQHAANDADHDT